MTGRAARAVLGLCATFTLFPVAGCERSLYPVTGRVTYTDGSPLSGGRVVLDSGAAFSGAWGAVRPDGTFVMGTKLPDDGVRPGKWRVYLANAEEPPPQGSLDPPTPLVHPRYTSPDTSGLVFEVPAQTDWQIVVEKPSPPAKK